MEELMSRIGTLVCLISGVSLAACGAQQGGGGGGADDDVGVACAQSTDCPADQVCSAELTCVDKPPAGELAIELVPTAIVDERGDSIDFATGVPVHTHAGPSIALGGGGCPAVYKYSYLLDPEQPLFGSEVTRNPLAWQVHATGTVASADFRVRTATTTELDWSPAAPSAGDTFAATLYRSGSRAVPVLGSAGQYFIDFRVRDAEQHEAITTACWEHHPLAAPVLVGAPQAATALGSLQTFTLAADSPVSRVINAGVPVRVLDARISHQTAEPVTVQFEIAIPTAGFTKTVVNDLVPQTSTVSIYCGTTPGDPVDPVTTGPVTTGNWTVQVLDTRTGVPAQECAIAGRKVTCTLPGRPLGQPAKELTAELLVNGILELRPANSGTIGEFSFDGRNYTGLEAAPTRFRCDHLVGTTLDGETTHTCTQLTTFSKLAALDHARLEIAGPAMTLQTAIPRSVELPGTALEPAPYVPGGSLAGHAMLWDSGDDDLPGTH
jgi:hypothetical protein